MSLTLPRPQRLDRETERHMLRVQQEMEQEDRRNLKNDADIDFRYTFSGEVRDKGGAVYNVKHPDYGALGDGSTDDTTAIQAAINAAGVGGHVYFPPGDYRFSSELSMLAFQRWSGNAIGLSGGSLSSSVLTYTASSGVAIRAATASTHSMEALTLQNNAFTYTDATYSGSGSTAAGLYLTGNITMRDCVWRLWNVALSFRGSNYYCKVVGSEFGRIETAFQAAADVFNLDLISVKANLANAVCTGTASNRYENLTATSCSFENYNAAFNSLVDASFFGTYFETDNDVDTPYGFFSNTPPDDVSLHLFGCKVFMNYTDRFVNLSGLTDPTFVSIGNQIEVGVTKATDGLNHYYVYAPASGNGRLVMMGDTIHGRGAVAESEVDYLNSLTGRRSDLIVFPTQDAAKPAGLQAYIPLPVRVAFSDGDATPSVAAGDYFVTANTGATTITDFDGGVSGQDILVEINDANTTIDFTSSGLKGNGGADWSPTTGDFMRCTYNGTDWLCSVHEC